MKTILLIFGIIYFLLAWLFFKPFSLEQGVHEPPTYTLKSFWYALFFPITFIYRYFNHGCLE